MPFSLPFMESYNISLCKTDEEWECALDVASEHLRNVLSTKSCPSSCTIIQYSGEVTYEYEYPYDVYNIQFYYTFAYPETMTVYEEYLIYDTIGMIGSIGGTLGMFIGFSCSNVITLFINYLISLKIRVTHISKKTSVARTTLYDGKM